MSKIIEISVSSSLVHPHPRIQYSMLKPMVSLKASLEEGDDPREAHQKLRVLADELVKEHLKELYLSAKNKTTEAK